MCFTILPRSHVDHVSPEVLAYIKQRFAGRTGSFIETLELPETFGTVPSALWGPVCGDPPVPEDEVCYSQRPGRRYVSRLVNCPPRPSRLITVVAGPSRDRVTGQVVHDCVLYTCFGGPFAPKECNDPRVEDHERPSVVSFWAEHALAVPASFGALFLGSELETVGDGNTFAVRADQPPLPQ